MTTANVVFAGPVEAVKPLMREANIASGQTLYGGMIVRLSSGEWIANTTPNAGGDLYIIDMDTIGQQKVTDVLTVGEAAPAFIPEVGKSYNLVLAASQTIAIGAALTVNNAGAVDAAAVDGSEEALFYAEEAVTTTGATGRIRARYNPTGVNALT